MTEHPSDAPGSQPSGGTRSWLSDRFGVVRPKTGRQIAGVCAALGHATGTDPVLWRVVLAVLTLVGGTGAMVYLAAWLLLREDGDEVSPIEALLGRGQASTPAAVTVLLTIATVMVAVVAVAGDLGATLLLAALAAGLVALVSRRSRRGTSAGVADESLPESTSWEASYRPPFAPHGPFRPADTPGEADAAATAPTSQHRTDPLLAEAERLRAGLNLTEPLPHGPHDTAVLPPPSPPKPRSRSVLGRMTASLTLTLLGLVAIVDVAGADVTPSWYVATALATVGLGLLVGTWWGRARWLIAVGTVLTPLLLLVTLVESLQFGQLRDGEYGGNVTWAPTSVTAIAPSYQHGFGNATLDLRNVDFRNHRSEVELINSAGNADVWLPREVDAEVRLTLTAGNVDVFGTSYSSVRVRDQIVTDYGPDGPGGGKLVLRIHVAAGNVEVKR